MVGYRRASRYFDKTIGPCYLDSPDVHSTIWEPIVSRVVITLPAHNEEATVVDVIQAIITVMEQVGEKDKLLRWQIVLVDDCSTDNTALLAETQGVCVIRLTTKSGLAEVFRQEMEIATQLNADWIIHLDSDGQHSPLAIPLILDQLACGNDLVIGSRFLEQRPAGKPLVEQFESRSFSRLLSWLIGQTLTDVHSGFRGFTRQVAEEIPIHSSFSYAREQILRTAARGFTIAEVPISSSARQHGQSRLIKNRYKTMLGITWHYCIWSREEGLPAFKLPIVLGWGLGVVAASWARRRIITRNL
jgi:glycosyltransferase involved in cell wall biosynthesis